MGFKGILMEREGEKIEVNGEDLPYYLDEGWEILEIENPFAEIGASLNTEPSTPITGGHKVIPAVIDSEFLDSIDGREWLDTPEGKKWLKTKEGKSWKKTNIILPPPRSSDQEGNGSTQVGDVSDGDDQFYKQYMGGQTK